MSKILNHPKVAHPNRLVNKHEEYLINKSLANKVRNVKSSIPVENQIYERILTTRQKRETQRSSHNKVRLPDSHDDLEGDHYEYYDNNRQENDILNYYSKGSETLPGRPAGSSSRSGQDNSLMMAKSGPIQFVSSPRSVIERGAYGKFPASGTAASYRVDSRGTSPDRTDYIAEKIAEKNREVELLKSKLAEKSHEIESLKCELRDKRSEGVSLGGSPSKENQVQNGQTRYGGGHPTTLLNRDISGKSLKPISMGKSTVAGIERQNSDVKMKKQLSLGSEKKMSDMMQHQAHYEESLRILERFEEIEKSKKKLEPIKKEVKVERPASVKNKTKPNNEKFKIRFSNNLEQGSLKANTRYKSDGVEVIDEMMEQEREETQSDIVEEKIEKLEIKEPKVVAAAAVNKRKNNRYQQQEKEEDYMEMESPQIIVTSKTLMMSRNNVYASRNHGLTDSEVLIE